MHVDICKYKVSLECIDDFLKIDIFILMKH